MRSPDDRDPLLDGAHPHDGEREHAQEHGIIGLLAPAPKTILDLGCGAGRLLVPLARQGHRVCGIDRDAAALGECRERLAACSATADLIAADFVHWVRASGASASFDAITCLGNTFMTIADLDEAIGLLAAVSRLLAAGGRFILDDLPHDLWPELTEGNWCSGVSADGSMQLLWHPDDAVFTIRRGESVDDACWAFREDDVLYRLWTSSGLRMAARLAGLSEPHHHPAAGILTMERPS